MNKFFILLLCFAATAVGFSIPPRPVLGASNSNPAKSPGTHELVRVGEVNNKTYYADNAGYVNWTEAQNVCETQGMVLATVETDAEFQFVYGTYIPGVFFKYYWTAAQDSQLLSQLRWKKGEGRENQTEITDQIRLYRTDLVTPPLSCGAILSSTEWMYLIPCSYNGDFVGILCETV